MRIFTGRRRFDGEGSLSGQGGRNQRRRGEEGGHGCVDCMVAVARQPIFDRRLVVYGYELLYRSVGMTSACFKDAVAATAQVIVAATLDVGMKRLCGMLQAFVNFPRELLVSPLPLPLPMEPRRVVIEVLENVRPDAQLLRSLASLRCAGYRIALDDFQPRGASEALLAYTDIVKLDIQSIEADSLAGVVARLRSARLELIAEKIETPQELDRCKALGFDGYQGFFLQRPQTFSGRRAPTGRLETLRLLLQLNDPTVSLADFEAAIVRDSGICYRVLRCVNSSYYGLPRIIESIRHAIVMLGLSELRTICAAILLAGFDDRPGYLPMQALVRARMCEELCVSAGLQVRESYFLVGMLSLADALLGLSLQDALLALPLSELVRSALLSGQGPLGEALSCVRCYERGEWTGVRFQSLPQQAIADAYREAVSWSEAILTRSR